jgi:hypothetical protein
MEKSDELVWSAAVGQFTLLVATITARRLHDAGLMAADDIKLLHEALQYLAGLSETDGQRETVEQIRRTLPNG